MNNIITSHQLTSNLSVNPPTDQEIITTLLILLDSLSYEFLSPDSWWLAMHSAKKTLIQKYNFSEEKVNLIFIQFEQFRKNKSSNNPLNNMFI